MMVMMSSMTPMMMTVSWRGIPRKELKQGLPPHIVPELFAVLTAAVIQAVSPCFLLGRENFLFAIESRHGLHEMREDYNSCRKFL